MTARPSLPALERLVAAHRLPEAVDVALIFATRSAAVFGQLITAGDLKITATDNERLLSYYRWIDSFFHSADFARRIISSASSPYV